MSFLDVLDRLIPGRYEQRIKQEQNEKLKEFVERRRKEIEERISLQEMELEAESRDWQSDDRS